jgi:hypothetical protein
VTKREPRDGALGDAVLQWAPYVVLTAVLAASAWVQVFTAFFFVDDEGYLMLSLQQFAGGAHLYDQVFSQYGPFLFESYGAFFKLTGIPLTTDAGRVITWLLWVETALGYGLVAQRLTHNRWIGLLAELAAFPILFLNAKEPMHPTGPTALLVVIVLALVVRGGAAKRTAIAVGALVAAIALIKINVGALAGVGIVIAAMLALPRTNIWRWWAAATALAVVTPFALMKTNLDIGFYREFLFLAIVWPLTAIARIFHARATEDDDSLAPGMFLGWLVTGGAAAAAGICLIIIVLGTSISALVHGVLLDPLSHPAEIIGSPQILGVSLWLSALMLLGVAFAPRAWAWIGERESSRRFTENSLAWRGTIRFAAAAIIVASLAHIEWVGPPNIAVALPPLLSWLAVVAPSEFAETRKQRFVRAAIVFVALFEILQAYPAPGAQLLSGLLTFVLVAALLAADGMRLIALWTETATGRQRRFATSAVASAGVAVALYIAIFGLLDRSHDAFHRYRSDPALELPGASMVHLIRPQAETLQGTVKAIKHQNCQTLLTVPGMNSFHLWSGVKPPTGENLTHWFIVLDSKRQQKVVDAIRNTPGLCILRNAAIIDFWVGTSKDNVVENRPLWRYLQSLRVRTVYSENLGTYGTYQLQVPDPAGKTPR